MHTYFIQNKNKGKIESKLLYFKKWKILMLMLTKNISYKSYIISLENNSSFLVLIGKGDACGVTFREIYTVKRIITSSLLSLRYLFCLSFEKAFWSSGWSFIICLLICMFIIWAGFDFWRFIPEKFELTSKNFELLFIWWWA